MSSTLKACATAALLAWRAAPVTAQAPEVGEHQSVRPMTLNQTRYRLRAGESTSVDAPRETLDFLLHAKTRRVQIAGKEARGFAVGPNRARNQILLAASLAMKPGEYTMTLSAITEAGERRDATLRLEVDALTPVPSTSTQPPVILLNGWQLPSLESSCPTSTASDTFGNLADYLAQYDSVPEVYFLDNCTACPNCPIEELGSDLAEAINSIQYDNGTPVPQVDLIAHSMGGLIVRSYLSGKQTTPGLFNPPINPEVRKTVFIATPHFGSFQADDVLVDLIFALGVQTDDMKPGSQFLFDLATWNQFRDDLRGTEAVAIIGNAGAYNNSPQASDGLVSLTSASLRFAEPDAQTRIVDYCHVPLPAGSLEASYLGCSGPGIADIDSTGHPTYLIIQSFLAGDTTWETIGTPPSLDQYLSANSGLFLAAKSANDQYFNDLTSVTASVTAMNTNLSFTQGPDNPVTGVFFDEWVPAGAYDFTISGSNETLTGSMTTDAGGGRATFFKEGPLIFGVQSSVTSSLPGLSVASGSNIMISGTFGAGPYQVFAGNTPLSVSSSGAEQIIASLPASFSGLVPITVSTSTGQSSIEIMTAPASAIASTPSSLQFAYTVGGTLPAAQSIQVTNSGGGTLTWSASATAAWLALSDSGPSTLAVSISPAGLAAGTYTGSIQISAAGASNSPVAVAVTLAVATAQASLAVTPQTLTFSYAAGGATPVAQSFSITNAGGGTLSWAASSGASWLSLSPASGTAPASLTVSVNPATLAAGTYTGSVQVTALGASGSPASVGVTLVVQSLVPAFTVVLATAGPVEPLAAQSIVSAYGANLATGTAPAMSLPLPTSLDGTTVTVTDSAGVARLAPLFYVSAPQINFEIPAGTATGTATVGIQNKNGTTQNATIQIGDVSPGLFQANYTSGLAAALVLPVNSAGVQGALQPDYQLGAGDSVIPLPINLGPSTETVYLEMYGTGIRNANSVTATVGGLSVPVQFHGPAPGYAGEDQVNIGPLPHSLSGRGSVNIILVADGQPANTVNVTIQ
jgi:uncharacterized protein (TIGR03437 family)